MKAEKRGERIDLTVSKWGNSLAVRLPADSLKQLGVGEGDTLVGEIAAPQRAEFRRAAELAGDVNLKLRAGDALHLTIAEASNVQGVLCLDEMMGDGAKAIGLRVVSV